jgi:hypothetical protein
MNAEHLKTVIKRLLAIDPKNEIQAALNQLNAAVVNQIKNKNAPNLTQTALSAGASAVEICTRILGSLTPSQKRDVTTLKAERYYGSLLPAEIQALVSQIGSAPSVVRDTLHNLTAERAVYLDALQKATQAMDLVGIPGDELSPGEAQLEILLPRTLFNDDLHYFQRELDALYKIIRTFYELNNETPERIVIKHISASDPTIVIPVAVQVALAIGAAVKLCLDILNGAYGFRKAMNDARTSKMADEGKIQQMEEEIGARLESRLREIAADALASYTGDPNRRIELESHALRAITLLNERIDHGMQIVPRIAPPDAHQSSVTAPSQEQVDEINKLTDTLEFLPLGQGNQARLTHLSRDNEAP